MKPGDFVFFRATAWTSKLILLGQWFRFHGTPYGHWSHCALAVSETDVISANAAGIQRQPLSAYAGEEQLVVDSGMSDPDRAEAVAFATSCLREPYGYLELVFIGLSYLTGMRVSIALDGQEVCSSLVARSLERGTAIFPRDPSHMAPGDLAQYYKAVPTA